MMQYFLFTLLILSIQSFRLLSERRELASSESADTDTAAAAYTVYHVTFQNFTYDDISSEKLYFLQGCSDNFAPADCYSVEGVENADGVNEPMVTMKGDTTSLAATLDHNTMYIKINDVQYFTYPYSKEAYVDDSFYVTFGDINYADITDKDAFKTACSELYNPAECYKVTEDDAHHVVVKMTGDTDGLVVALEAEESIVVGDTTFLTTHYNMDPDSTVVYTVTFADMSYPDITDTNAFKDACDAQYNPAICYTIAEDDDHHTVVTFKGNTLSLNTALAAETPIMVGDHAYETTHYTMVEYAPTKAYVQYVFVNMRYYDCCKDDTYSTNFLDACSTAMGDYSCYAALDAGDYDHSVHIKFLCQDQYLCTDADSEAVEAQLRTFDEIVANDKHYSTNGYREYYAWLYNPYWSSAEYDFKSKNFTAMLVIICLVGVCLASLAFWNTKTSYPEEAMHLHGGHNTPHHHGHHGGAEMVEQKHGSTKLSGVMDSHHE